MRTAIAGSTIRMTKVRFEISQAFLRNLPVIPVSIDGAPVPKATQLPDNIMQLSYFQAMLLRTESFPSDAEAIAQRLKAMLVERRQRGVPTWAAYVAAGATLTAGIAAGPLVLTSLRLPFFGVTLPGDPQPRSEEVIEARRQLDDARTTAKNAEERVMDAEQKQTIAEASLKSMSERLAAVERERRRAQQDVASLEGQLAAFRQTWLGEESALTQCQKERSVKAPPTRTADTRILIKNLSGSTIQIYWIDISGERVKYNTLTAGAAYTQPTFVGHPWVATDAKDTCIGLYVPGARQGEFVVR
jgi:VHL beta domain